MTEFGIDRGDAPSASREAVLSFDQFWQTLARHLRLEGRPGTPQTSLRAQLELDSLQMMEVGIVMDELGAEVVEEMVPSIETLGDLYDHYVSRNEAEARWG